MIRSRHGELTSRRRLSSRMIRRTLAAAFVFSVVAVSTVARAETGALTPVQDTWVDQNAQSTNHGTDTTDIVKARAGQKRRTLVRFDLSSFPACVSGVSGGTLRFNLLSNSLSTNVTHNLHRVTAGWTETGATWLTRDGSSPWTTGAGGGDYALTQTAATATGTGPAVITWDVSSDVAAFLNASATNYGWIIKDSEEGTGGGTPTEQNQANTVITYDSRESSTAANRPQLILNYTVVPGSCDDNNPCTDDACTLTGCTHTPNNASCDDGSFCNGADTCAAGSCSAHAGSPCSGPDGDANCSESCNEVNDTCTAPDPNGSACNDGLFCTGTDTCLNGACSVHSGDPCAGPDGDGNCSESCNEAADNCTAPDPNGSACTDGLFCNGADTCNGGTCSTHAGNPCPGPDGDANCSESCNEAADNCAAADPNGSACTDGLFCDGADTCSGGSCSIHAGDPCAGGPECNNTCNESADNCLTPGSTPCADDGNVCTGDICNGGGTCAHPNNTAPCDDGAFCNGTDTCGGGSCSVHSGNPCPGPDGDGNCSESCNEAADTCTAADPNGSACSDGVFCNGADTCSGGTCSTHAGNPCPGPDGDANCSESCDEAADTCTAADPNGSACSDGVFCNGADTCSGGACSTHAGDPCTGGSECADTCNEALLNCFDAAGTACTDDGNVCTNDRCNGAGTCAHPSNTAPCNDGAFCNGTDTCSGGSCSVHSGDPCTGGPECADTCNETSDNCLNLAGTSCTDDGDVCTNDQCNGAGACLHPNNTAPCSDGNACTYADTCSAGVCTALPACGNGSVDAGCGEQCDPPNGVTCDASCQYIHTCGNGIIEPLEECDDGNTVGGDCCDANCQVNAGPCDDGSPCTTGDVCTPGGCVGTPLDCSFLDSQCTEGQCDEQNGECESVNINEGGPCNDGNACSANDVCSAGICSSCGNGSVDGTCGETCDPPQSGTCDPTCQAVACGNNIIQAGEECDDGNAISGDGCSDQCKFEEKVCINGTQPSVSIASKTVAFASTFDYVGGNADGNEEIYLFQRKKFDKAVKVLRKKDHLDLTTAKNTILATRASEFFSQITDTVAPVVNDFPALNGSGNVVAFVSNGDLKPGAPGNADGNREIFRVDLTLAAANDPAATVQVTNTVAPVSNANPNLRAFSNLLTFDSNGNLVPDRCVGGTEDLQPCTSNADCAGTMCGNPEGNREVFVHVQNAYLFGDQPVRQLTAAASGDSTVGQAANFSSRSTAFSSTSNLMGANPEFNSEIFRIARGADSLSVITATTSGNQEEPAQSLRARIAFTSNGDLVGDNPDGNREIFLFDELSLPQLKQLEDPRGVSAGCYNAGPSIDGLGRFVAFHSTCNRIASLGNPTGFRSIFIWDDRKGKLLPLVIRGENNAESARPQATKRVAVLTYESNLDSVTDPAICFLNVRGLLKTLDTQQ